MRVTKPVYAIPGNHDWYDALEGFAATFLDEPSARTAMRARIEADYKITTTTEDRINELILESKRLRGECHLPTGFQQAPFFRRKRIASR
jgi:DNA repair exonuclease SbcCD nuclease subunit